MTLAEWKRRMVKGARLLHVSNARGPVNEIYTVSIVQTNGVFMTPDKERPDKKDLWMTFPKAKGLTADNNGFTLTYEGGATSVYQWVKS